MMLPGTKVGYVIGKGGEMIRSLQDRAGVKMTIFQESTQASDQEKQLRIVGPPDKVDYAKQLVVDLLTEKEIESIKSKGSSTSVTVTGRPTTTGANSVPLGGERDRDRGDRSLDRDRRFSQTNEYGSSRPGHMELPVPANLIGLVIGKGGDNIKRVQQETGTKVQFDANRIDDDGNKVCTITGQPHMVERAAQMVQEIIENAQVRFKIHGSQLL